MKEIDWFGKGNREPKKVVKKTKDSLVNLGRVVVAGLFLGAGIKAFKDSTD